MGFLGRGLRAALRVLLGRRVTELERLEVDVEIVAGFVLVHVLLRLVLSCPVSAALEVIVPRMAGVFVVRVAEQWSVTNIIGALVLVTLIAIAVWFVADRIRS